MRLSESRACTKVVAEMEGTFEGGGGRQVLWQN